MSDAGSDLAKGQQFGGYEIVRLLGKGAFGGVYEALRQPLKKRTALKVLHAEFLRQDEVVGRFLREAETVAQIEHPHIVGVFDVGTHDGVPFIAMEFLDGESLAARIERERKLDLAAAVDLALPVFAAVSAVHARGIIHRDLKPDNIFLARPATGGVQPKLLDFGIAKVRDAEMALTRSNAVLGTPYYMSPEQAAESKNLSAAADQWSLGVIIYEMVTGTRPFEGDGLLALLNAICFEETPDPRGVEPGLPAAFAEALRRAMAKKATDRFPSVCDFGRAILPFASAGARAQWREVFDGAANAASATALRRAADDAAVGHATTQDGRGAARSAAAGAESARTLEPATRSTLDLGAPRSRIPMFVASVLGGIALVGVAVIALRPSREPGLPMQTGSGAHAAGAPRASVTTVPPETASTQTPSASPTSAAPPPAAIVLRAPTGSAHTPAEAVDAGAATRVRASSGRHRRSRQPAEGERTECVNGICPPI